MRIVSWFASMVFFATILMGLPSWAQDVAWSRYGGQTGIAVDLPFDIFSVDRGPTKKLGGRTFATPDGRANVSVYSIPNAAGDSPRTFLEKRFQLPASSVYQRVTDRIMAVSGFRRDKIWYARCNFGSRVANCVSLNYPASEKSQWDAVVTRISNSLSSPNSG